MQSEIAFRSEEDVRNCVMSFYINKIKPKPTPAPQPQPGPTPTPQPQPVPDDVVKKARGLVREQTMPSMMWQKVVLDLIEEHPEVAQFIIKYLGS